MRNKDLNVRDKGRRALVRLISDIGDPTITHAVVSELAGALTQGF